MSAGTGALFDALRRNVSDALVLWYWRNLVIPKRCPCSWPVKSKRLMHLCGRMDDAYDRIEFRRSVSFIMGLNSHSRSQLRQGRT